MINKVQVYHYTHTSNQKISYALIGCKGTKFFSNYKT